MFKKLNTRITRTLAATLIPAAMAMGLAGTASANVNQAVANQMNPTQPSNSLNFSGTAANGATVTLQLCYVGPKSVNGIITVNGTQYTYVAYVEGSNVYGVLNDNGRQVRFNAVGQANLLYLQILGTNVTLQMV